MLVVEQWAELRRVHFIDGLLRSPRCQPMSRCFAGSTLVAIA